MQVTNSAIFIVCLSVRSSGGQLLSSFVNSVFTLQDKQSIVIFNILPVITFAERQRMQFIQHLVQDDGFLELVEKRRSISSIGMPLNGDRFVAKSDGKHCTFILEYHSKWHVILLNKAPGSLGWLILQTQQEERQSDAKSTLLGFDGNLQNLCWCIGIIPSCRKISR